MSGSVWLNPPRPPRGRAGQSSSRDQVAEAAVELADAGGLEAVTMRSVAERIGVSPMSLYWYVESKSQIVELMIELTFREQVWPRGDGWRELLRSFARGNRRRYLAHPWLNAAYAREDKVPSPAQLALYERVMSALVALRPTLTTEQLSMIIATINHLVAGHASVSVPGALASRADDPDVRDYLLGVIQDGDHPAMAQHAAELVAPGRDRFDAEVEIVLTGLAPCFEDASADA